MSLRDRLTRRQNGPVPTAPPVAVPVPVAADGRVAPSPRGPGATVTSGMYGRKIEEEVLTPVDRVKIDLHRKLVERLDLEALEEINDERIINSEIRAVVTELLREESTPLTLADRENIIEQVLYEITGLGPLEPGPLVLDDAAKPLSACGPDELPEVPSNPLPAAADCVALG